MVSYIMASAKTNWGSMFTGTRSCCNYTNEPCNHHFVPASELKPKLIRYLAKLAGDVLESLAEMWAIKKGIKFALKTPDKIYS